MVRIGNRALVCYSIDGEVEYGSLHSRLGRRILHTVCSSMVTRCSWMVRKYYGKRK